MSHPHYLPRTHYLPRDAKMTACGRKADRSERFDSIAYTVNGSSIDVTIDRNHITCRLCVNKKQPAPTVSGSNKCE